MFQKIIIAIVFLFVGCFLGYAVTKKAEAPIVSPQAVAPNPFFDLLDKYTSDKDVGTAQVLFMKPEADKLVFMYPTSQESVEYGVYDYKTNEIFTQIGMSSIGGSNEPVALLGNDRLLVVSYAEDSNIPTLVVKDFKNTTLQTLSVPDEAYPYFHEAYGYHDSDGRTQLIFTNKPQYAEGSEYKNYFLDETTYALSTQ